ncbi:MAG: hypothetical protein AAF740_11725, partial [Bacteroidota bacterium]
MSRKQLFWIITSSLTITGGTYVLWLYQTGSDELMTGLPKYMPFLVFGAVLVLLVQVFRMLVNGNIYQYQPLFFSLGLALSLSATWLAFEWKWYERDQIIPCNIPFPFGACEASPPPFAYPIYGSHIQEVPDELETEDDKILWDAEVHPDDVIPEKEVPEHLQPLVNPQVQASPECGFKEFMNYVRENVRYPISASRICIEGRVIIGFTVEKDGTLSNFESPRPLGYGLEEAVIEA